MNLYKSNKTKKMEQQMHETKILNYFKELISEHDLSYEEAIRATARNFNIHEDIVWELIAEAHAK